MSSREARLAQRKARRDLRERLFKAVAAFFGHGEGGVANRRVLGQWMLGKDAVTGSITPREFGSLFRYCSGESLLGFGRDTHKLFVEYVNATIPSANNPSSDVEVQGKKLSLFRGMTTQSQRAYCWILGKGLPPSLEGLDVEAVRSVHHRPHIIITCLTFLSFSMCRTRGMQRPRPPLRRLCRRH